MTKDKLWNITWHCSDYGEGNTFTVRCDEEPTEETVFEFFKNTGLIVCLHHAAKELGIKEEEVKYEYYMDEWADVKGEHIYIEEIEDILEISNK